MKSNLIIEITNRIRNFPARLMVKVNDLFFNYKLRRLGRLSILLTNTSLIGPGGTEYWTLIMAKTLSEMGHIVVVYSPNLGYLAWQYICLYCTLTDEFPRNNFDLVISNHNDCFSMIQGVKAFKIFTSHSWFLDIERCPEGADAYVAVSEHIKNIEKERGFDCTVINNPLDNVKFTSTNKVNDKPKTVFARVKKNSPEAKYLRKVCKQLSLTLITCDEPVYDLEKYFNQADIVIGIGREIVEAMLCERNVISMDLRGFIPNYGGAGMITPENFSSLIPYWFSGRDNPLLLNIESVLISAIKQYNPDNGVRLREMVVRYYNPQKIANEYLKLYVANKQ